MKLCGCRENADRQHNRHELPAEILLAAKGQRKRVCFSDE